ncbi:MAG: hypothetical protein DRP64_19545, partial [Verrucomicrobia bacterium]
DGSGHMWGVNESGGIDWLNWNGSWQASPLVSGNYVSVANKTAGNDSCYAARADGGIDWVRWSGTWGTSAIISGPTKYVDLAPTQESVGNGFLFGVTDAGAVELFTWSGSWGTETIASGDYISVAARSTDGFLYASKASGGIDLISWAGTWGASPLLVSTTVFTDLATDLAGNDFIWATTEASDLDLYLLWASGFGLSSATAALDLDFELDGLDNLTEYALGGNPTNSDAASIKPTFSGPVGVGTMEYVYSRRLDDTDRGLTYGLTVTTNDLTLNNWTPVGTGLETGSGPIDADFESVTNEIPTDTPIGFVGLEVASSFTNYTLPTTDYTFNTTISREVLERYLARSITMMNLMTWDLDIYADQMRMIDNIGAKFLGRAFIGWAANNWHVSMMDNFGYRIQDIHNIDPEIIVQGTIFEIITDTISGVEIPYWVFDEFGLPQEDRSFSYDAIRYANDLYKDHWFPGASVPDMSRLETKMWFYYWARKYIDQGYEAIHFGQVKLMDDNDPTHAHWWDMLTRVRNYAANNARRGMVLCDSHTHGVLYNDSLLFDFHSFPLRPKENCGLSLDASLVLNHLDSIYGNSTSGWTSSGWYATGGLPYLVEVDNFGVSASPGTCNTSSIFVWGYDEITWFAETAPSYRDDWLEYAYDWVRSNDDNGFFQLPGCRNIGNNDYYYANTPSANMPLGFGQEEKIKYIWNRP